VHRIYLPVFFRLAEHDDAATLLFPDHLPEVNHRVGQRALGGYVGSLLTVTLGNTATQGKMIKWCCW